MKTAILVLALSTLFACHGNESADSTSTDLDKTKNNDTSAVKTGTVNTIRTDSLDTARLKKQ